MTQQYRIKGELAPWSWKSGPDPEDHKLWIDCKRAKAQANFRNEEWLITVEEYIELWKTDNRHKQKGRTLDGLCMTRKDADGPWSLDNVVIIPRKEHLKQCNTMRANTRWGKGRQKKNV